MGIQIICRHCGYRGVSRALPSGIAQQVRISNSTEQCPRCGGMAEIQSGVYDFVGEVLTAFRAPGMTREKVVAFKDVIENVQTGELSKNDASEAIAAIESSTVTQIWQWVGENEKQIMVLLTVIGLFLAHYHFSGSISDSQDDQEVAQRQTQALEKIHEELEKMNVAPQNMESPQQEMSQSQPSHQGKTTGPNRHERRKAVVIDRRKKNQN